MFRLHADVGCTSILQRPVRCAALRLPLRRPLLVHLPPAGALLAALVVRPDPRQRRPL